MKYSTICYSFRMPPSRPSSPDAYEVARRLHQLTDELRQSFEAAASELDLTAQQARVILRLFEPTPMRAVADHLACDASNLTGIVSRLTARGLLTVTPGPDRRVKFLELTARGRRVRSSLEKRIARTSPAMTRLNQSERQVLLQLLDRLIACKRGTPGFELETTASQSA
ncbi:MAG: MarR family winged helix-turn-helix transcriptional regulator [Acidimicrobiales bacterium]